MAILMLEREARRLAVWWRRGKLASVDCPGHHRAMRRLVPIAALLAAGCATAPPTVAPTTPPVAPRQTGALVGLTAAEVGARFGQPRLQLREGQGTKLQWTDGRCVLDAYLYPPPSGQGAARVTHVDARDVDGRDVDQARCLSQIEGR